MLLSQAWSAIYSHVVLYLVRLYFLIMFFYICHVVLLLDQLHYIYLYGYLVRYYLIMSYYIQRICAIIRHGCTIYRCEAATNLLNGDRSLLNKWISAVDWLKDEMERVCNILLKQSVYVLLYINSEKTCACTVYLLYYIIYMYYILCSTL